MRFRLALALSVSVLLIGVASWSRFGTTDYVQPNIVAIEQLGTNNDYEEILNDFIEPKTASTTPPEIPLSNTDLIGRQLILDYINLAASGQVTETRITTLANRYVENIPTLNEIVALTYTDIKTVPDSKNNFENYSNELAQIYVEHAQHINKVYTGKVTGDSLNDTFYKFAKDVAIIYGNTAQKLKNLPVPIALASNHLKLVNTHFSSATSMESVFETEKDPLTSLAGFIAMNENLDKEIIILKEISQIIKANGI